MPIAGRSRFLRAGFMPNSKLQGEPEMTALGQPPDFLLGGRTSASAECKHWSGRAAVGQQRNSEFDSLEVEWSHGSIVYCPDDRIIHERDAYLRCLVQSAAIVRRTGEGCGGGHESFTISSQNRRPETYKFGNANDRRRAAAALHPV